MNRILISAGRLAIVLMLLLPLTSLAQTTHIVTVADNSFSPSQLTIQVGDTVQWVNAAGGHQHNVTSDTSAWTASQTASSFTFEVTFNQPGVFNYVCTLHSDSMQGTITVQAATSAAEVELTGLTVLNQGSASQQNQLQLSGNPESSKPNAFAPGDSLSVEAVIRNNGNASSGQFSITYYASTNTVINTNDIALGTFPVADLAAGVTRSQQNQPTVPDNIPAGQYFIGGILSFSDSNNGNNTAVDNISVSFVDLFLINAGLNDVWASPGKDGQGILIAVFPDAGVFFSAWFTFDSERPPPSATAILGEPGQRWITMQGDWAGNTANLEIFSSNGGVFDSASPPTINVAIGTMTIVFHDCGNATASYSIPSLGLMNTFPLIRIVADNIPLCEEINSALQP